MAKGGRRLGQAGAAHRPQSGGFDSAADQPARVPVAIGYIKDKFQYPGPIEYVRMNKYLASVSFVAINRQAPHPNAAKLFTDFFLGPEAAAHLRRLRRVCFSPGSRSQVQEGREGRSDRRR